jgi:hypothetical protein
MPLVKMVCKHGKILYIPQGTGIYRISTVPLNRQQKIVVVFPFFATLLCVQEEHKSWQGKD